MLFILFYKLLQRNVLSCIRWTYPQNERNRRRNFCCSNRPVNMLFPYIPAKNKQRRQYYFFPLIIRIIVLIFIDNHPAGLEFNKNIPAYFFIHSPTKIDRTSGIVYQPLSGSCNILNTAETSDKLGSFVQNFIPIDILIFN